MLKIISSSAQLHYGEIMQVYEQSIQNSGKENYPHLDENQQILEAEQDFYAFLKAFLSEEHSQCMVWVLDGKYASILRVEPYRDGALIEGLETAISSRRKGFAKELLSATIQYLLENGYRKIYSHIHKDNLPSVKTHLSCGFLLVSEHSAYIDGSVDHNSLTYLYEK